MKRVICFDNKLFPLPKSSMHTNGLAFSVFFFGYNLTEVLLGTVAESIIRVK